MLGTALLLILGMSIVAFIVGRASGRRFLRASGSSIHSLPSYHGLFVAVWVGVPALVLVLLWAALSGTIVDSLLLASLPDSMTTGVTGAGLDLVLSEIKNVAAGLLFGEPRPEIVEAAARLNRWNALAGWAMVVVVFALMIVAFAVARTRLAPRFRARNAFERWLSGLMIAASVGAILVTVGIVVSLLVESLAFFRMVPVGEFLFGLNWEPQMPIRADQVAGLGAFGAVPVFLGTIVIATVATLFAAPVGLFTAIYLVEYASERVRSVVKPVLEVLAGVPTIVYGFFAVLTVAPAIRSTGNSLGLAASPNSALAAGVVMGIMLIPFISSLSDDALRAVPRSLRDGSLAIGATRAETVRKVMLAAALPGIMGGVLLAVSRAIGETMIVVMAAGLIATLTINPLDSVTTVTVQIVTLLIGDTAFDSPKTLAAFALGLVLFLTTLLLNVIALRIVNRYREKYD
ncbi:MAG: phosphate ABC transporter permease subunit PstC [Bauldia sp.]|nr:phosphate ABC transporter permease subunit PstC [Bauldia sp.]